MTPAERLSPLALGVLCALIVTSVMNASMTSVALPDLQAEFGVGADSLTWFITAYIIAFATGTIVYGRLADMLGVKPLLVFGLSLFAVASLAIALLPWYWPLVGTRAIQGAGATSIASLSMATIVRTIPADKRGPAMGMTILAVGFGFGIGPLAGGALTEWFGWRAPFLLTALLTLGLLPLATRLVPSPPGSGWGRFDAIGGIALVAGVAGLIVALNRLPIDRADPAGWAGLALAAPGWLVVVWREWRFPVPFIERSLLRRWRFLAFSLVALTTQGAHFGTVFLLPILLAGEHGLSIIRIGLVLLPGAIAIAVFGAVGGRLTQKFGVGPMILTGSTTMVITGLLLQTYGVAAPPVLVALYYAAFASGYGVLNASVVTAATGELPPELAGLGTGVYNLLFFMGGAITVALAGTIVRTRAGADAWNPLHTGIGGAYSDAVAVICAFALVGLATAVVVLSRRVPAQSAAPPSPAQAHSLPLPRD